MGQHTRLIFQAYQKTQKKQSSRYRVIIAGFAALLLLTAGLLYYQSRKIARLDQLHATAERIFYTMKSLEIQVARIQSSLALKGDLRLKTDVEAQLREHRKQQAEYNSFAREELEISQDRLSPEDWLIYKVARLFGECDVSMPKGFAGTVREYIRRWQSTSKYRTAIERARALNYIPRIAASMIAHDMPPQFCYLALQESTFDVKECGPPTRSGIAKGMWMFMPETAMRYGMRTGPLIDIKQYDPVDERHNFEKSTDAAAQYLRELYQTDAQGSGLLVMACYNWGEDRVLDRVRRMPDNPRERNFWSLLAKEKIPEQTYDYVFSIIAATVIGENPRLFGFDFDNPLEGATGQNTRSL